MNRDGNQNYNTLKRRSFIKKTGLASAGIVSAAPMYSKVLSGHNANNTINLGIIGTGDRGKGLASLINSIENINVIGLCDVLPFRLEEGLSKIQTKAKGYEDYRRLLDHKAIDAVIVATPFNTHSQIAIDALDAGKHVYCEKTLAKGYEEIQNLVNKAKATESIFQTGHQYHSSRLYNHVLELIKGGQVGQITAIECQWNRNGNWRRPVPDPKLERAINWRMYREFSGGLTAELCSHQIDFANWVLGETPDQVMGTGGINYWKDGRETFDHVHMVFSYPGGVKGIFTSIISNAKDGYQIKVMGDKGTLMIDYTKAWFYPEGKLRKTLGEVDGVSGATVSWDENKGYPISKEHLEPTKQALIDFRDAILNNKQPLSNIYTGAQTAICVQMALDAMYNNEVVKWKKDFQF